MLAINVLPAANPMVTTMMGFPEISQETYAWVNQQRQNSMAALSPIGQSFMSGAMDTYKHLMDGSLTLATRRMARAVNGLLHPNTIIPLETIEQIQSAKELMQRYIMACPAIRTIYHQQLCDGYSDTYTDLQPGVVGDEHYDYRRVMDGVLQPDPENPGGWRITEYFDELVPGDRELDSDEQFTILDVWQVIETAVRKKVDPTDIFGGKLGI